MNHEDLIQAYAHKKFAIVELKTNKDLILQAMIDREVLETYHEEIQPDTQTIAEAEKTWETKRLQNPMGVWIHRESGHMCVASILRVVPEAEIKNVSEITLLGVVCGVNHTLVSINECQAFANQVQEATRKAEQKSRYAAYAAVPELEDLLKTYNLTPEDF